MESKPAYPFFLRFPLILLSLVIIGFLIVIGQNILVPVAFSILLSVLLMPLNNLLEKYKWPRVLAIILSLLLSLIFIAGIIYFISIQIASFTNDINAIEQHLNAHWQTVQKWINQTFNVSADKQDQLVQNGVTQLKDSGTSVVGATFSSLTQVFSYLLLIPVYSFLFLYYRDLIKRFFLKLNAQENHERVREILKESSSIIQGYMLGLMLEMAIVTTINAVGFLIIGIKYAIFLGLLAAILNMIPYIGMLIASVLCMIITLSNSNNIGDVIWVAVVLIVVQFIDNNIIMPNVVSSKVKINALISILGVLIGGALAGVAGMFLSIPGIAILKIIFDRIEDLQPWGMMMGDDTAMSNKKGMKLKRASKK